MRSVYVCKDFTCHRNLPRPASTLMNADETNHAERTAFVLTNQVPSIVTALQVYVGQCYIQNNFACIDCVMLQF